MTELSASPGSPSDAEPDARQDSRGSSSKDTGAQLLRTDGLTKHFKIGNALSQRTLHAVDDVSLSVGRREIVALAGEIYFEGKPIASDRSRADQLRYSGLAPMVFQDPFASINPVFRVSHGVMRGLKLHRPELSKQEQYDEAIRVFDVVGLTPAADVLQRYPHELSGGQRQRVGFAQALAMRPKLIIADEPVSMLDVSIRVGLLNLMVKLRDEEDVSILYITHDLASARYVADRLVIMYAAMLAESGPMEEVLTRPKHPYTQLLLSAAPDPRAPLNVSAETDRGEPPKVIDPTPGCRFRWRCPLAIEICHAVTPRMETLGPGHEVACHVAQSGAEVKAF